MFFHRRNDYVNNMLKVINSSKELRQIYNEVEALHRERAQYENRYEELKALKVSEEGNKPKNRTSTR